MRVEDEPHKFAMVPLRSRLLWQEAYKQMRDAPHMLRNYEWVRDKAAQSGLENGHQMREAEAELASPLNTLMRGILSYSTGYGVSPLEPYQFTSLNEGVFTVVVWEGDIMILKTNNSGIHVTIGAQNGSGLHEGELRVVVRDVPERSTNRMAHRNQALLGILDLSRVRNGGRIEDRMDFADELQRYHDLSDIEPVFKSPLMGEYIIGRNPAITRLILMCDALEPWMKSATEGMTNERIENAVIGK